MKNDVQEQYDQVSDKAIAESLHSCMEVIATFGNSVDFQYAPEEHRQENLSSLAKAVAIMEDMPTLGGLGGFSVLEWARDVLILNVPGYAASQEADLEEGVTSESMH